MLYVEHLRLSPRSFLRQNYKTTHLVIDLLEKCCFIRDANVIDFNVKEYVRLSLLTRALVQLQQLDERYETQIYLLKSQRLPPLIVLTLLGFRSTGKSTPKYYDYIRSVSIPILATRALSACIRIGRATVQLFIGQRADMQVEVTAKLLEISAELCSLVETGETDAHLSECFLLATGDHLNSDGSKEAKISQARTSVAELVTSLSTQQESAPSQPTLL